MKARAFLLASALSPLVAAQAPTGDPVLPNLLLYTRTTGFHHESIPAAVQAITELGEGLWNVTATEDPSVFTEEGLSVFNATAFVSTTGDVLDEAQQGAFLAWLAQDGKGFASIHSACDSLRSTYWYERLVGAYFERHPNDVQDAVYRTLDNGTSPATAPLPELWTHRDEIYTYHADPRANNITLILSVEPDTYTDQQPVTPGGEPRPIAWQREPGFSMDENNVHAGRFFQTGLGHDIDIWEAEGLYRSHIQGGLLYILNLDLAANTTASEEQTSSAVGSATTANVLAGAEPSSSPVGSAPTSSSERIAASWTLLLPVISYILRQ